MADYDLHFGRIALPTIFDDISEAVGDTLEAIGGAAVAGERRARALSFSIPVHGVNSDVDSYAAGRRLRRQVRALMENPAMRLNGLWFGFDVDTELDGWIIVGGGDLQYAEGGITVAEFKLALSDVYRVGKPRSHRQARRVELYDRRSPAIARDVLGTIYDGTSYSTVGAVALAFLPSGYRDVTGVRGRALVPGVRESLGGNIGVVASPSHGEVLSFERDARSNHHSADDVVVYDRQGRGDPGNGYAATILNLRPVLFARLGEAPGATVADDASIFNADGAYVGAPSMGGEALTGDPGGTSTGLDVQGYARFPDAAHLDFPSAFTIVGLLRPVANAVGFNHVSNGSFEPDIATHLSSGNIGLATLARITTWSTHGGAALRFVTNASAAANDTSGVRTNKGINLGFPVRGGRQYTLSAMLNVISLTAGATVRLRRLTTTAGNVDSSETLATTTVTGVQRLQGTFTVPADATSGTWIVDVLFNGASQSAEVYVDEVQWVEGAARGDFTDLVPAVSPLAAKFDTGGRAYRFGLFRPTGDLMLWLSSDGTATVLHRTTDLGIPSDLAVHLAASYDAGATAFYRNGAQVGAVSGGPATLHNSNQPLVIGRFESE